MSRHLVITWNARTLRYLLTDADRQRHLRVIDAGREELNPETDLSSTISACVKQLVERLKAEKSKLIILINRGSVDSATFQVPPAAESELPALIQNLAVRDIPGATDQTPIDFIAYKRQADGSRSVSAMALVAEEHLLIRQLIQQSGCRSHRVLVSTHPLRAFVPELLQIEQEKNEPDAATLVVSRGDDVAEVLICDNGLPLVSRTIRLAADVPSTEINRYLRSETQRTLISASGQLTQAAKIAHVVIVGNETQTSGLDTMLAEHFGVVAAVVRPTSMVADLETTDPLFDVVNSGSFATLLAAAYEDARSIAPAIDFANPRRPVPAASRKRMYAAIAAVLVGLVGGGYYYVWAQFHEIDEENARLVTRLNDLNDVVKDTESRRQMVRLLSTWENNRISWPDELRDLTERIPSSPDLVVQQLTISSAGPGTAVATFRGVGKSPDVIAAMEAKLRDKHHEIRIPGVREQQEGNKVIATFQATLTIRQRSALEYSVPPAADSAAPNAQKKVRNASAK
jgi:Tfp pilus assembly PilM family ATPase